MCRRVDVVMKPSLAVVCRRSSCLGETSDFASPPRGGYAVLSWLIDWASSEANGRASRKRVRDPMRKADGCMSAGPSGSDRARLPGDRAVANDHVAPIQTRQLPGGGALGGLGQREQRVWVLA